MPRANHLLLPGYAWHITHRCHRQQFLLKFARDRCWSQALDVGHENFVHQFQQDMGISGRYREITLYGDGYRLGETEGAYNGGFGGEMVALRAENSISLE